MASGGYDYIRGSEIHRLYQYQVDYTIGCRIDCTIDSITDCCLGLVLYHTSRLLSHIDYSVIPVDYIIPVDYRIS